AKKKKDEGGGGGGAPAWMATFSDLMNLLLCFFVLLFSMSSVEESKWEQVVASMTSAFSIFSSGSTSIGSGSLVGIGTSQLSNLDEYYSNMGQSATEDGEDVLDKHDPEAKTAEEELAEAGRQETAEMLDKIAEMTERYSLYGDINVSADPEGRYVELTVSGSLLFDSGKADLKTECLPLLSKVGDILKVYAGHYIDIIGHTDNVPMSRTSRYRDNLELSSARAISATNYLVENKGLDIKKMSWTGRGEYEPIATNSTAEGRAMNRRVEIRIYNSFNNR
ncbi:MAG: flagellar motor protein MotB, partial [Lachnospiraceae bacterium]|nr:flagellar motor protein MotB [Lachnospiraceae bacterium]